MTDAVAAYSHQHSLGRLERRVPLRFELSLSSGELAPAEVCLTPSGAWLVAALDESRGTALAIHSSDEGTRYALGKREDWLSFGVQQIPIPAGRREQVLEVLGLARLRARGPSRFRSLTVARHIEELSALERAALEKLLDDSEHLLAHLRLGTVATIDSWLLGTTTASGRVVMTDQRLFLLTLSAAGDTRISALDPSGIRVDGAQAQLGDVRVRTGRRLTELVELAALAGRDRVREVARLNWLNREKAEQLVASRALLDELARLGDVSSTFIQFLLSFDLGEPATARPALVDVASAEEELPLGTIWKRWQASSDAGRAALDALYRAGPNKPALALHRELRAELERLADGTLEAADIDLEYAAKALSLGERQDARDVLEQRLEALPAKAIDEIAPVSKRAAVIVAARARVLETLARARGTDAEPDLETLTTLARLQPFAPERLDAVISSATGDLLRRAQIARQCIFGALLTSPREAHAVRTAVPLATSELDLLRHPSTEEVAAMLGTLQALLATRQQPDVAAVRDYCARVTTSGESEAASALQTAQMSLELHDVEAYVSRGRKDVGIRGWDSDPPFVLIGGRHLIPGDPHAMTETELVFSLTAELAHLKFGHARVTTDEVWAGALAKGRQGLDVFLGVLPVLKGLHTAGRMGRVASQIEVDKVRRAVESASAVNDAIQRTVANAFQGRSAAGASEIAATNERLIAAHRFVQLSADRVGLVVAGDLVSALRAIFLTRRDYGEMLAAVREEGIERLLMQRLEAGETAFGDLSVRIAALISFFLSDDYARIARERQVGAG